MPPATVQTAGVVLANTTGLPEAPPVAETVNVPPAVNTGAAGFATKAVIAWTAWPIATLSVACGAALKLALPAWSAVSPQLPAETIVTVAPATVQTAGVVLANTTGLPEAPPVAETMNVPPAVNTGAAGVAVKAVMAWVSWAIATV